MRSSAVVVLVLAASFLAACASDPEPSAPPEVAEPITVLAADATREELGVVVWGADGDERGMRVVGYDARGARLVTLEQRAVKVDAKRHYFETTLATAEGPLRAHLEGTVSEPDASGRYEVRLVPTENTIASSPHATKVLERVRADFDAEGEGPRSTSLLETRGLAPQAGGGQRLISGSSCLSTAWRCGISLWRLAGPLLPCASVVGSTALIVACGVGGFAAGGPAGAAAAAGTCAAPNAQAIGINASRCAIGAEQTYNGWSDRTSDISNSCGSALSACGRGSAMASLPPGP